MYLLYFFELKDICSSLPNAFLASRLNDECLCIEDEVTVKKYTLSLLTKIFFLIETKWCTKGVLMALLHSRPEIPQCSTIWLRISNLKRIRLHTFFSTKYWCSVFNLENMRQAYPAIKQADPKLHFWTPE